MCSTSPPASKKLRLILPDMANWVEDGQVAWHDDCVLCNRFKGPNIAGIDRRSGKVVSLFHPRRHKWHRHFRWNGPALTGLTPIGRTTIAVLNINDPEAIVMRAALMDAGLFPQT